MKRNLIIVGVILVLGLLGLARVLSPEDTWICDNGQWIKHGQPSLSQPETACELE